MEDGEIINVQKINEDIKMKQRIQKIKECSESGTSVLKWCKENGICEQT